MKKLKILLIPAVLTAFIFIACDNDNSSNAQDIDTPATDAVECPCFDETDVTDLTMNSDGVSCENTVWGFNLIADSDDVRQIITQCSSAGTNCSCLGPGSDDNFMNISLDEAGTCVHTIVNGLIQLGSDVVVSGGCSYVPPN